MLASIPSPSFDSIDIGPLSLNIYGLLIALGVVAAIWLMGRRFEQRSVGTMDDASAIGLWAVFAGVLGSASAAHAGLQVAGDAETYLKFGGLLQAWAAFAASGAPDGEAMSTEFYVRRMRLILYGQLNVKVNFFIETDNPNFVGCLDRDA